MPMSSMRGKHCFQRCVNASAPSTTRRSRGVKPDGRVGARSGTTRGEQWLGGLRYVEAERGEWERELVGG
jgi:hypothetical protein